MAADPNEEDARHIARSFLGEAVLSCDRFPTGLRNWVYDVAGETSGRRIVVRISHPKHGQQIEHGVSWLRQLAEVGVPVCEVLDFDDQAPKPFMILKRLPGTDIGNVIGSMTASQTTDAARTVAAMQTKARGLPPASGFGYAPSYESPLHTSWRLMLEAEVEGARRSIVTAGVVDAGWVDNITQLLDEKAELLADVEPAAFLDDATTKNVIVDDGQVVGLVDVDHMAFGDPLWAVALTRMSLLAAGHSTLYADAQIDLVSSSPLRHQRVELYTALHCLNFLAELGQQFNQVSAPPVDIGYQQHLETILTSYVGA